MKASGSAKGAGWPSSATDRTATGMASDEREERGRRRPRPRPSATLPAQPRSSCARAPGGHAPTRPPRAASRAACVHHAIDALGLRRGEVRGFGQLAAGKVMAGTTTPPDGELDLDPGRRSTGRHPAPLVQQLAVHATAIGAAHEGGPTVPPPRHELAPGPAELERGGGWRDPWRATGTHGVPRNCRVAPGRPRNGVTHVAHPPRDRDSSARSSRVRGGPADRARAARVARVRGPGPVTGR